MSGTMRDLIQGEADVDDDEEENDESFDEETGEPIPGKSRINGELDDSSEEEEDDDDEEAARAVCCSGFISVRLVLTLYQVREGFIIDDEDEEPEERERRRRKDKKRRRAEREEEEAVLDEEDLDLIGEANPEWERKTAAQVCII
jgi:transcription elongation factor SPT6